MKIFNRKETREKRKTLRHDQTEAEKLLWSKLRFKQMHGHKFFRQYGIGSYIVDFFCPTLKLIIELDGGQHYSPEGRGYDAEREKVMHALGMRTLRFSNRDILLNIDGVLESIASELV